MSLRRACNRNAALHGSRFSPMCSASIVPTLAKQITLLDEASKVHSSGNPFTLYSDSHAPKRSWPGQLSVRVDCVDSL